MAYHDKHNDHFKKYILEIILVAILAAILKM